MARKKKDSEKGLSVSEHGNSKFASHVQPRLAEIYVWIANGETMEEVSNKLGLDSATIYRYMKSNEALCNIVKRAREAQVDHCEKSLFKLANGMTVVKERVVNGEIVELKEEIAPNFNALSFILRNKRPEEWKDKHEVEVKETKIDVTILDNVPYTVVEEVTIDTDEQPEAEA